MKIKIKELEEIARKAIKKYGYTDRETEIILEILMYAQLRGNNQGLIKLIGKGIPKDKKSGKIIPIKETELSVLLNGNQNHGMLVMKKAAETALEKVKKHGFCIIGTQNTSTSAGALGYYAREIAKNGYLGFVFAGVVPLVAPFGSYEPKYGTNPLSIGVPTDQESIVLDMSTAATAWYGLVEAQTAGRKIPPGIAYDKKGKITCDPTRALEGAILSFDKSYKGSGLGMIVEILTGPLVGANFVGIDREKGWGNLIFVIDPALLGDIKEFKKKVTLLIQKVKKSKKLLGIKEIFFPGERGNRLTNERLKKGKIEIEENLLKELKKVAGC